MGIVALTGKRCQIQTGSESDTLLKERTAGREALKAAKDHPPLALWNALLSPGGTMAYLPIIFVAILMFCGASWQLFWSSTDAARYQCYALIFWLGNGATNLLPPTQCLFLNPATISPAPFHSLPLEYPPLTIAIFSLSLLAPIPYYQLLFALWMALVAALIYWLLLRYGPRGSALAFAFYALVGAWATAEGRFDMVPAALTLLCLIAAERKHWTAAYVALAFGVLLKIYPILFLPALFIAEQHDAHLFYRPSSSLTLKRGVGDLWRTLREARRWHWKNTLIFLGILVGITGIFALIDFQGAVVSQVTYFAHRPVQIESTGSTFLWIATKLGFPAYVVYTFGSLNIISSWDTAVSLLFEAAFLLGYAYTLLLQWRGKIDLVQACVALLLVFIAGGKVFSPQYLIWVIPLLAYSGAYDIFWLLVWGITSLLTTIIYPYLYTRTHNILLVQNVPGFVQIVGIRDAFFVFITLAYLFNWLNVRRRRPLPPELTGKETRPLYASDVPRY